MAHIKANTQRSAADRALSDYPVQRIVPAAGVANSVFQQGAQAREQPARSRQTREPVDPANVKAYADRPMPDLLCGRGARSVYATIWDTHLTKPGASVDLTRAQAKSMISWAKKQRHRVALRQLGPDLFGVWRL